MWLIIKTHIFTFTAVPSVAAALLVLPGDFETYITMIRSLDMGNVIITAAKYILGFPVIYHYINGIRHLVSTSKYILGFPLFITTSME